MESIKVLIADDHKLYREGIKALLDGEEDIEIILEANNGEAILQTLAEHPVDIILMDIDMPGMGGVEATQAVRQQYPNTRILILSMYDDIDFILKVLKAGASGYLLKESENLDLHSAIKALAIGSCYYSDKISSKLSHYLVQLNETEPVAEIEEDAPALTKREQEVLALIGKEYTNAEIADKLFISTNTVFTHRKNLIKKLNARNTAGLIRSATKFGFI